MAAYDTRPAAREHCAARSVAGGLTGTARACGRRCLGPTWAERIQALHAAGCHLNAAKKPRGCRAAGAGCRPNGPPQHPDLPYDPTRTTPAGNASRAGSAAAARTSPRPLLRTIGRWSRFDQLDAFLAENGHLRDFAFLEAALRRTCRLRYHGRCRRPGAHSRARPPADRRQPSFRRARRAGAAALRRQRAPRRAHRRQRLLSMLEPLSGLLLPVRILGGRRAPSSLRAIDHALDARAVRDRVPGRRSVAAGPARRARWALAARLPALRAQDRRRRCCRYGSRRATRRCSMAPRRCSSRRRRPCWRARCTRGAAGRWRCASGSRCGSTDGDAATALRKVRKALYALGRRDGCAAPVRSRRSHRRSRLRGWRRQSAATELLGMTADGKQIRLGGTARQARRCCTRSDACAN